MAEYITVFVTTPDEETAVNIVRTLVEERLASCGNIIGPIRSIYRWKGKIEDEPERLIIMKTRAGLFESLKAKVLALHPYEVPEVVALDIAGGSPDYLAWIREVTEK